MPSHLHEALLELFRNRPALAAELLRDVLGIKLPDYREAALGAAELNALQPTEYRADLVVVLRSSTNTLGIVLEMQRRPDKDKSFTWPVYLATLRARLKCPVRLLVFAANKATARWAAKPIHLGPGNQCTPLVLGPSGIPVITDVQRACSDPELAVLSAIAHGKRADPAMAALIGYAAQCASETLDEDRRQQYLDIILDALSEGARRALQAMDPAKYQYRSEFARGYFAQGEARGRADLLTRLLTHRFGPLPDAVRQRLASASVDELDAIGERLLTAAGLPEALGTTD